jgi:hypothetical protein
MPRGYRLTCRWKLLQLLAGQVGRMGVGLPGAEWEDLVARVMECPRGAETAPGNVAAYKLYPQSAVHKQEGSVSTLQLGDSAQIEVTV